MPKMKTNKAMKARFKVTGTGKVMRGRPGRRHILTKKSSKRKRNLARPAMVANKAQASMIKRLLGV